MQTKLKAKEKLQWTEVTEQNTQDIAEIKTTLVRLEDNHIHHIEKDMEKQSRQIEKIDNRIWWVLGLLVASLVISMVKSGIGV